MSDDEPKRDAERDSEDYQLRTPELDEAVRTMRALANQLGEPSLWRRIARALPPVLYALPIAAAVGVCLLVFLVSSWRLPAAHPWALYALVALPSAAQWLMGPLAELRFQTRADQPRELTAGVWLRQRLERRRHRDVTLTEAVVAARFVFPRYAGPRKVVVVPEEQHHARGAVAYAWAARTLGTLRLVGGRRELAALPQLLDAARGLHAYSAALLLGAALVGLPALRLAALALLAAAAASQLAGVAAFHLRTTAMATRELRADPRLEGPPAELAIRQLRRESAAELLRAAAYLAVALAAPSLSAPLPAALPLPAAPPLHGLDLFLAAAAALLCAAATAPCLAIWRSASPPWVIALSLGALVCFVAVPSLVALTWNQPFALAHPWAVALGFAAVWPRVLETAVWIPGALWRATLGPLWLEPDPFVVEPPKGAAAPAVAPAVLPGPASAIAVAGFLFKAAVFALPLPLAYLTLRASL